MTDYRPVFVIDQTIFYRNNELLRKFVLIYWIVLMVSALFYKFLIIRERFYNVLGQVFPIVSMFNHTKTIWLSFKLCSNGQGDKSASDITTSAVQSTNALDQSFTIAAKPKTS